MNVPIPPEQTAAPTAGTALTPFHPITGASLIEAGSQSFHIQPDQLPKVLAGLDEVRVQYEAVRDKAIWFAYLQPPFWDDVTVREIKRIRERAVGGEGNLAEFAEGLISWIDGFTAAVKQAIQDHQRIDEESSME